MTSVLNTEKDYFNYVISFINVATSGKDTKNIIQRMFENDAIVRIYTSSKDQIKELKKFHFSESRMNLFLIFSKRVVQILYLSHL